MCLLLETNHFPHQWSSIFLVHHFTINVPAEALGAFNMPRSSPYITTCCLKYWVGPFLYLEDIVLK